MTGRWGYSGVLWHLNFHSVSYGILLINLLEKEKKKWLVILLFSLSLLLLGQKAGLLYLSLIFVFVVIKKHYLRLGLFMGGVSTVITVPLWLPYVVSFLPFWENVYHKYGVWGVVFSLRNENIGMIWNEISVSTNFFDWLSGGAVRFPTSVEMMLVDVLFFYGLTGLLLIGVFYFKLIPRWAWGIPLFVACFAGGIYEAPIGLLVYFVVMVTINYSKNRHLYKQKAGVYP